MKRYSFLLFILFFLFLNCGKKAGDLNRIVIWHQMRVDERVILEEHLKKYMELHPDIKVEALYKETESLRSGFYNCCVGRSGSGFGLWPFGSDRAISGHEYYKTS